VRKIALSTTLSLILILFLSNFILTASAETSLNDEIFSYYVTSDGNAIIKGCTSQVPEEIIIPETIGQYPVTGIESLAFSNRSEIISIVIPENVVSVGYGAFSYCENLKYATIYGATSKLMFEGCYNISTLGVPAGVSVAHLFLDLEDLPSMERDEYIDVGLPPLSTIIITRGEVINRNDFDFCYFTIRMVLPESINEIEKEAFVPFSFLMNVYFCGSKEKWSDINIGDSNWGLGEADVHYNAKVEDVCSNEHVVNLYTLEKKATLKNDGNMLGICMACRKKLYKNINKISVVKLSTSNYTYDKKVKTPTVTVKDSQGTALIEGEDYTVTFLTKGRKNIGEYKLKITFKGNYSGTKTLAFEINPKVKLSSRNFVYNGKAKKPTISVLNANNKKISSKFYTLSYSKGRKKVGKYTIILKFKNGHTGTYKYTFKILPKSTYVSKVNKGQKSLKVGWYKGKNIDGYQIQYSTNTSFKSAKFKTVKGYNKSSTVLKNLKKNKMYFVRIRTYKVVKGVTYYSNWSPYRYNKTK